MSRTRISFSVFCVKVLIIRDDTLHSSNDISGLNNHAKARLDEYSYAAACLNFEDQEKM
jgi:hypothetical protein